MFPPFKTKGHPPSGLIAPDQFSSFTYWRAPLPDITVDDLDDVGDDKNEGTSSKQWLLKVNKCESSFRTLQLVLEVWGEGSAILIILRFGMFLVDYHHCVVPENIHTSMGGQRKFWGEGGQKGGNLLEWKFQGVGPVWSKIALRGGMDIFWNYTLFLYAPISTYKFSTLNVMHFLKELVGWIWLKIKALLL